MLLDLMFKKGKWKELNHLALNFFRSPLANPLVRPVMQFSIIFPAHPPWDMNQEDFMCH